MSKNLLTLLCLVVFLLISYLVLSTLPAEAAPRFQITEYPPTAPGGHEQTSTPNPTRTPEPETAPMDRFLTNDFLEAMAKKLDMSQENPYSWMHDAEEVSLYDHYGIYQAFWFTLYKDGIGVYAVDHTPTFFHWRCDLPDGMEQIDWKFEIPWVDQVEFDASTCKRTD